MNKRINPGKLSFFTKLIAVGRWKARLPGLPEPANLHLGDDLLVGFFFLDSNHHTAGPAVVEIGIVVIIVGRGAVSFLLGHLDIELILILGGVFLPLQCAVSGLIMELNSTVLDG